MSIKTALLPLTATILMIMACQESTVSINKVEDQADTTQTQSSSSDTHSSSSIEQTDTIAPDTGWTDTNWTDTNWIDTNWIDTNWTDTNWTDTNWIDTNWTDTTLVDTVVSSILDTVYVNQNNHQDTLYLQRPTVVILELSTNASTGFSWFEDDSYLFDVIHTKSTVCPTIDPGLVGYSCTFVSKYYVEEPTYFHILLDYKRGTEVASHFWMTIEYQD